MLSCHCAVIVVCCSAAELSCVFTQQGVNVNEVNQCLSSHVSGERHRSVSTPFCFAIICSLSPNTHRSTRAHTNTLCALIHPLLFVNIPTSWPVQPKHNATVVFHVRGGWRAGGWSTVALAFRFNIYGGRCESVTTASCAQWCLHSVTRRFRKILVTPWTFEAQKKRMASLRFH